MRGLTNPGSWRILDGLIAVAVALGVSLTVASGLCTRGLDHVIIDKAQPFGRRARGQSTAQSPADARRLAASPERVGATSAFGVRGYGSCWS